MGTWTGIAFRCTVCLRRSPRSPSSILFSSFGSAAASRTSSSSSLFSSFHDDPASNTFTSSSSSIAGGHSLQKARRFWGDLSGLSSRERQTMRRVGWTGMTEANLVRLVPDRYGDRDSYEAGMRLAAPVEEEEGAQVRSAWEREGDDDDGGGVPHRSRDHGDSTTPPPSKPMWKDRLEKEIQKGDHMEHSHRYCRAGNGGRKRETTPRACPRERGTLLQEEEENREAAVDTLTSTPSSSPLAFPTDEAVEAFLQEEDSMDQQEERIPTLRLAREYYEELASYANEELDLGSSALVEKKTAAEREEEKVTPHTSFFTAYYQQQGLLPVSSGTKKAEEIPTAVLFQRLVMQQRLEWARLRVAPEYPLTRMILRHQLERHCCRRREHKSGEEEAAYGVASPSVFEPTPEDALVYTMRLLPEPMLPISHPKEETSATEERADPSALLLPSSSCLAEGETAIPAGPPSFLSTLDDDEEEVHGWDTSCASTPLPQRMELTTTPTTRTNEITAEGTSLTASTLPSTFSALPSPVASLDQYYWLQRQVACGSVVLTDTFSQWIAGISVQLLFHQLFAKMTSPTVSSTARESTPLIVELFGGSRKGAREAQRREEHNLFASSSSPFSSSVEAKTTKKHDAAAAVEEERERCGASDIVLDVAQYLTEEIALLRSILHATPPAPATVSNEKAHQEHGTSPVLQSLEETVLLSLLPSSDPAFVPSLSQRVPHVVYVAPETKKTKKRKTTLSSSVLYRKRGNESISTMNEMPKSTALDAAALPSPLDPTATTSMKSHPKPLARPAVPLDTFCSIPAATLHGKANVVLCLPPTSEDGRRVRGMEDGWFLEPSQHPSSISLSPACSPNNFLHRCHDAGSWYFPRLKQALRHALECVEDGGCVIYGTQSMNPIENEAVVCAVWSAHVRAQQARRTSGTGSVTATTTLSPKTTTSPECSIQEKEVETPKGLPDGDEANDVGLLQGVDWIECVPLFSTSSSSPASLPPAWETSSSLVWREWYASSFLHRMPYSSSTRTATCPSATAAPHAASCAPEAIQPSAPAGREEGLATLASLALPPLPLHLRCGLSTWYGVDGGDADQEPAGCVPAVVEAVAKTSIRVNPLGVFNRTSSSRVDDFWFSIVLRVHRYPNGKEDDRGVERSSCSYDTGASPFPLTTSCPSALASSPLVAVTMPPVPDGNAKSTLSPAVSASSSVSSSSLSDTSSLLYLCPRSAIPWWMPPRHFANANEEKERVVAAALRQDRWCAVAAGVPIGLCTWEKSSSPPPPPPQEEEDGHSQRSPRSMTNTRASGRSMPHACSPLPKANTLREVVLFSSVLSGTTCAWLLPPPLPTSSSPGTSSSSFRVLELPFTSAPCTRTVISRSLPVPLWCLMYLVQEGELSSGILEKGLATLQSSSSSPSLAAPIPSSVRAPLESIQHVVIQSMTHVLQQMQEMFSQGSGDPIVASISPRGSGVVEKCLSSTWTTSHALPPRSSGMVWLQPVSHGLCTTTLCPVAVVPDDSDRSPSSSEAVEEREAPRYRLAPEVEEELQQVRVLGHCTCTTSHVAEERPISRPSSLSPPYSTSATAVNHKGWKKQEEKVEWCIRLTSKVEDEWTREVKDPFKKRRSHASPNSHSFASDVTKDASGALLQRSSTDQDVVASTHMVGVLDKETSRRRRMECAMVMEQQEKQRSEMRVRLRDTLWYTARHIGGVEALMVEHVPSMLSVLKRTRSVFLS